MSKIEILRDEFQIKQDAVLAAFARVQFAITNAHSNQWDSISLQALEEASSNFSTTVLMTSRACSSIVLAMAGTNIRPTGPSPAELTAAQE
jgi:hypothetical protein